MSWGALDAVENMVEVKGIERFVLYILAYRQNSETLRCDPSLSRLQRDTGLTRPTLSKHLWALHTKGLIRIESRYDDRGQLSNFYHLLFATPLVKEITYPPLGALPKQEENREDIKNPPTLKKSRPPSATAPPELEEFDSTLREGLGDAYHPTGGFYATVLRKYGGLDLVEEAVKMVGYYAANPGKNKGATSYVLNWLGGVRSGTAQRQGIGTTRKRDGRDPWADGTDGYRDDGAIPTLPEVQRRGLDLDASGPRAEIRE
ncbi:hypothetical protein LCGC14_0312810 [marine sediment metagenome]|uniref:Uncharacterized protein n=1 Tax=marine sediment metagenome TaxID=412755 RepID=A0A0F9TRQ6_9ZZZZ